MIKGEIEDDHAKADEGGDQTDDQGKGQSFLRHDDIIRHEEALIEVFELEIAKSDGVAVDRAFFA